MLVELIKRYTQMPVCEAEDGMLVQPDCTYIIPPNHDLDLVGGALHADASTAKVGGRG